MANNPYQDGAPNRPRHAKHAAQPGSSKPAARSGAHRAAARSGSDKPAPRFRRTAAEGARVRRPVANDAVAVPGPEVDDGPMIGEGAPRPIDVDPSKTGISTLVSGQGAVLHDRDSAAEAASAARSNFRKAGHGRLRKGARPAVKHRDQPKPRLSRPAVIGICVGAGVVAVLIVVLVVALINTPSTSLSGGGGQSQRVEQVQDDALDGIEYGGYTYSVRQDDDGAGYSFVRAGKADAQPQVLFQLQGTPVTVVLYNGAFVIPENLDGKWDVVSWVMGDGSVAAELAHEDGTPVAGDGTLASAKLDGSNLVLTFGNDVTDTVALG